MLPGLDPLFFEGRAAVRLIVLQTVDPADVEHAVDLRRVASWAPPPPPPPPRPRGPASLRSARRNHRLRLHRPRPGPRAGPGTHSERSSRGPLTLSLNPDGVYVALLPSP